MLPPPHQSTGALLDLLDQLLVSPSPEPPGSGGRTSSTTSTSSSGLGGRGSNSGGSGPCRPPPAAGFALVRPPGHHVLPSRPMGFGVFNTIAVAARYARERHGVERVSVRVRVRVTWGTWVKRSSWVKMRVPLPG